MLICIFLFFECVHVCADAVLASAVEVVGYALRGA